MGSFILFILGDIDTAVSVACSCCSGAEWSLQTEHSIKRTVTKMLIRRKLRISVS